MKKGGDLKQQQAISTEWIKADTNNDVKQKPLFISLYEQRFWFYKRFWQIPSLLLPSEKHSLDWAAVFETCI